MQHHVKTRWHRIVDVNSGGSIAKESIQLSTFLRKIVCETNGLHLNTSRIKSSNQIV